MFEQVYEPAANNLALSALVALIPIVVLFVMLAVFSIPAHWSSLASLAVAFVIAVAVYGMPIGLALDSMLYGVTIGFFLIVWLVVDASFLFDQRPGSLAQGHASSRHPSRACPGLGHTRHSYARGLHRSLQTRLVHDCSVYLQMVVPSNLEEGGG